MLQIKAVSKEYQTGELIQRALDGVSLNLRDNEFVAILGPSGSGKTTLLNIIGGLDRYDDGDLVINGISTKEYTERNWDTYRNHSIGFVFQSYNLIPHQSVLANVELALTISGVSAKERKERATKALEQVGLGDQIEKRPNQMSGGQMQRVALARALVNDPDILLADEPTGALDSETSIQVMNLMKEVARDRLVVMVTHNPELAEEYATRIVRLKDGRIIDDSMPCSDEEIEQALAAKLAFSADVPEAAPSGEEATAAGMSTEGAEDEAVAEDETENVSAEEPRKKEKRLSSMSFFTSLALSFSNLRTKKGRTILTAFAGSIGIIGIALILSLSTGVNDYINKIQRDTMASYPISISATSFDLSSVMGSQMMDQTQDEENKGNKENAEENTVKANFQDIKTNTAVTTSIKKNNLTEFKKYLDDENSEIHQYIGENGIVYTYNVDFKVYSYNEDGKLVDSDIDLVQEYADENNILGNLSGARSLMMSNMSAMFGFDTQNAVNFSEMTAGANGDIISAMIKDNYDVVYGSWPNSYDEVVLVLRGDGSMDSGTLYRLGLITKSQYDSAVRAIENEEEPEPISLDYQDLCSHEFLVLTASDQYLPNENGTFTAIGSDQDKLEDVLEDAVKLRIVGIVKETEDSGISSLNTAVAYTTKLTDHLIERGNSSSVVTAQLADPETDALSGQPFMSAEPTDAEKAVKAREYIEEMSEADKENFYPSLMVLDSEGSMQALMNTQMSEFSGQLQTALQGAIGSAISEAIVPMIQQMMTQVINQYLQQMSASIETYMAEAGKQVMEQAVQQLGSQVMEKVAPQVMDKVMKEASSQLVDKMLPQIVNQAVSETLQQNILDVVRQIEAQIPEGLPPELAELKDAQNLGELILKLMAIDFSKLDLSGVDFSQIDLSKIDFSKIDLSEIDLRKIDLSALDFSVIDLSGVDLSDLNLEGLDLSNLDLSGLDLSGLDFSNMDLSGMDFSNMNPGTLDLSSMNLEGLDLGSGTQSDADTAETVDYWLQHVANMAALVKVYDQFIGVSDYEGNLKKFGYVSYDTPSSISLYADTFEGKDGISASLKRYNDNAKEEDKITFTDYVALLTTSITTIIDAISYVLIGFVGVSLFVSCIMIGIITNISVLERTKEIGVLRALGASRRNVSNVFNAETFIIGGFSGIIGVGVSLLLTIPINAIVHALMDSTVLSAKLPPVSALILIVISIVITMIGGLIPAGKAAKQDPVIALRTE